MRPVTLRVADKKVATEEVLGEAYDVFNLDTARPKLLGHFPTIEEAEAFCQMPAIKHNKHSIVKVRKTVKVVRVIEPIFKD